MKRIAKRRGVFDSGFESTISYAIERAVKATRGSDFYRITSKNKSDRLQYSTPKNYVPDFKVFRKDGSFFFVETKGWLKPSDRQKMISVKRDNPTADIRIVFQSDNWLTKAHKRRYSDWAIENGFKYCVGMFNPTWLIR